MEIKTLHINSEIEQNHLDLKLKAGDLFKTNGFPNSKSENYKYSDLNKILNGRSFEYSPLKENIQNETKDELKDFSGYLVFENGILNQLKSIINDKNIIIDINESSNSSQISEILNQNPDGVKAHHIFNCKQEVKISIKEGIEIEGPLIINIVNGNDSVAASSIGIHLGEAARLVVLELNKSKGSFFNNSSLFGFCKKNSHLEYIILQDLDGHNINISNQFFEVDRNANATCNTFSLNGNFIRNNLNFTFKEVHSEVHLNSIYIVSEGNKIDNQTFVNHAVPCCMSNEFYKGIIAGNGVGVFNGKVYVEKDAQRTNAYQSNKNLLLSNEAGIFTKPQLEIFADDVKCSHGATIGEIDENALFYLKSRGISTPLAKKLLVEAYGNEIAEKIQNKEVKEYISKAIWNRIETLF